MITTSSKGLYVLSNKQLDHLFSLLSKQDHGTEAVEISLDLNLSQHSVTLDYTNQLIEFPDGNKITKPESFDPSVGIVYFIAENSLFPLKTFNEDTNFYYQLVPTSFRPILRISATQMHKRPFLDFLEKIKIKGTVLDAGTGLGYSAAIACRTADKVITVEWDTNVIEIASFNPHSAAIFDEANVELYNEDITEKILEFSDNHFDNIIHDGGTPKSSGKFFSQTHANQLYRVLRRGGRLYFYLPKKGISKGRDFGQEQIDRMKKAGFYVKSRAIEESFAIFEKRG